MRITLARDPFEGASPALILPLGLLAAFAIWTLSSTAWSDAPARALLEFDRALLYVLVLAFFGTLTPRGRRVAWGLRGLAGGIVIVCGSGLITRVAADVWPIAGNVHADRLSYPVTYWNALGLLAAIGLVVCVYLTTSEREPRTARVLGAAAIPMLAATLLLTFSRASLGLVVLGIVLYLLIARPRGLLGGALATGPALAVALVLTYRADLLASERFDSAAAVAQGHDLALTLALCILAAAVLRFFLLKLDDRIAERPAPETSGLRKAAVPLALLGVLLVAGLALGAPGKVESQWDRFVSGDSVDQGTSDARSRLTDAGNNGRLDHWNVALDAFAEKPLAGNGAGTYQLLWARDRPYFFTVNDGHSLYLEVLGELGIVGLLLLGGALLVLLGGVLARARGPERHAHAAVFSAGVVWALHAGLDWDWEMPVVTLWLFALCGMALATGKSAENQGKAAMPGNLVRVITALGVMVLAVTPVLALLSQNRLDESVTAFKQGDCQTAIDTALGSLDALNVRPEPYEIIGYCDIRQGENTLGLQAMRNAVERDPNSWEPHYGLAIARAAAGHDPKPQLRIAKRLNPFEPLSQDALERLGDSPQKWKRRAHRARLPFR